MPTFIKTGFWEKAKKGYKEWLNLDELIKSLIPTSSSVSSVTGFGVDNTDPLNPIVNKYDGGNITATGTNLATAAPIVNVYSRIIGGIANTGVYLDDTSLGLGNVYTVINVTGTNKIFYSNYVIVNGVVGTSVNLLPNIVYTFTWTTEGVSVSQEQVASGRIITFGNTPTIVASNPTQVTVTVSGNDTCGTITVVNSATIPANSGGFMVLTFSSPYSTTPKIFFQANNIGGGNFASRLYLTTGTSASSLVIDTITAMGTSTYKFSYLVVG